MSRRRCFTVDEVLRQLLEEDDDDFLGLGRSDADEGSGSSSLDDEQAQIPENVDPKSSGRETFSDEEHPFDCLLDPVGVAARYCNVQPDQLSGPDEVGSGAEGAGSQTTSVPGRVCGCQSKCLEKFDSTVIEQNVLNMQDMEKRERDLLLLGVLESLRHAKERNSKGNKRQRERFSYRFQGLQICVGAFREIYSIGKKHFANLLAHLEEHGPVPRVHGNTQRRPHNCLPFQDVRNVVVFLDNYATEFGIPHPAPLHGRDGILPIFLPASHTCKSVHKVYVESCATSGHRPAGITLFSKIWEQCLPHIKFMPPRSDVCETCEKMRRRVVEAVSEEAKLAATGALSDHILYAQKERNFYQQKTRDAKEEWDEHAPAVAPPHRPVTNELKKVHYTFDFAQNVSLPHTARQMGPLYFKTPYKVHLFGVNCEAIPEQVNFLLGEKDTIGEDGKKSHNPNTVVSLLHYFFDSHGQGEKECFLHADNCVGQNKNKTVISYLAWRCLKGLHEKITLSFMIAGHTRCLVDGCFGLVKQKYRRADCFTMDQLAEVVKSSAAPNVAQCYPDSDINWHQWDDFFVNHFRKVPNITKMHHFEFSSSNLTGEVKCRQTIDDDWQSIDLLKTSKEVLLAAGLPPVIPAGGLSTKRQAYLYSDIRPFVPEAWKDVLCPAPLPAPEED